MYLKALYLHHYRNITKQLVRFAPDVNVLIGANAQGKTNLIEAVYLLVTGRSFRTPRFNELIQHEADGFYVEALVSKQETDQRVSYGFTGEQRQIQLNQTPCPSREGLLGFLKAVILGPHDREMIKGGPSVRRQYLDVQLAQTDRLYLHHLARYHRAVKQRNALLRQKQEATLDVWERELAVSGAYLCEQRQEAVRKLEEKAREAFQELACFDGKLGLRYKSACSEVEGPGAKEDHLKQVLFAEREKALEVGHTSVGPHRDDLLIDCAGLPAKTYASEGQQRLCLTALRLAEWRRMQEVSGEVPILIIDEVGLSLDREHRTRLLDTLQHAGQVFVTSPEELELSYPHTVHHVNGGAFAIQEASAV